MTEKLKTTRKIIRVGGLLRELLVIKDEGGRVLHKTLSPFMVEFHFKDAFQVIIGAAILSIPVSFTEEVWNLGEKLPLNNVLGILLMSLLFISAFVYFNFYKGNVKGHGFEFLKRIVFTYLLSLGVVSILMTLIQQAPWQLDYVLALKRIIIVTFPASMSGTLVDTLK
ncbi:MAG: DUF2391 family protein [Candidatus Nealsonbacteria bacterium]